MRILIRYFFRGVRVLLAPVMLISEKLSTPKAVERTPEEQAQVDAACQQLELRDAQLDPAHKQALLEGGGKVKVPCLKITDDAGQATWLYESDEINRWLHQRFGA